MTSTIEFENKYYIRNPHSGDMENDGELIQCAFPECLPGEEIVLNAWGTWEDFHGAIVLRRRLGVYLVVSQKAENQYVLRELRRYSERDITHTALSGNFFALNQNDKHRKYIALSEEGRNLESVT